LTTYNGKRQVIIVGTGKPNLDLQKHQESMNNLLNQYVIRPITIQTDHDIGLVHQGTFGPTDKFNLFLTLEGMKEHYSGRFDQEHGYVALPFVDAHQAMVAYGIDPNEGRYAVLFRFDSPKLKGGKSFMFYFDDKTNLQASLELISPFVFDDATISIIGHKALSRLDPLDETREFTLEEHVDRLRNLCGGQMGNFGHNFTLSYGSLQESDLLRGIKSLNFKFNN